MAMLKSARLTDADFGNRIDNELGNLETDLAAIFGIPMNTVMGSNLFGCGPTGLFNILLQDGGAAIIPSIVRLGNRILYNFGANLQTVAVLADIAFPSNAAGVHIISASSPSGAPPGDFAIWDRV